MIGKRWNAAAAITALALWLLFLSGCASLRLPAIDPNGERIFLPAPATTSLAVPDIRNCELPRPQPAFTVPPDPPPCPEGVPPAPGVMACGAKRNPGEGHGFYGPSSGEKLGRIVLTPARLVAPVGTEVVLLAGLCDPSGHFIVNEPIEWIMSQESVGNFVDVGEPGASLFPPMLNYGSRKVTRDYALGRTAAHQAVLTRGTAKPDDDFLLKRGQNWISVTSPTEGVSNVTVWAPKAHAWDLRRQTATIHWVDAQWSLPAAAVVQAGQRSLLRTRVTRAAGAAAAGWIVRYEILSDGAPAHFVPSGTRVVEVPVDVTGDAVAQVEADTVGPGTARIQVQIVRPGTNSGEPGRFVVGSGVTTVSWSAAGLIVRVTGPQQAGVGELIPVRVEVSNPGDLYARGVVLQDTLPPTLERLDSSPAGQPRGDYAEWSLGDIGPQEVRVVTVNCRALRDGLMRYCFRATADDLAPQQGCLDLTISSPKLVLQMTGPDTAQVGEVINYDIQVTNTGTTPLTGVLLRDQFDPGLRNPDGVASPIEREIGTLAAGETRSDLAISFIVEAPGRHCHTLEVIAEGGQRAGTQKCVTATQAPASTTQLDVRKTGPARLAVGARETFVIEVANTGTTPVTNVRIVDRYDPSLKPRAAERGHRTEGPQAVTWTVAAIEPGARMQWKVVCEGMATDQDATSEVTVSTLSGFRQTARSTTEVFEGARPNVDLNPPETPNGPNTPMTGKLQASIIPLDQPTFVDKDNSGVMISLKNDRGESVRNVSVTVELPEGMVVQKITAPVARWDRRGNTISFAPIPELRAKETNVNFIIRFRPEKAGRLDLKATIESPGTNESFSVDRTIVVNER